MQAGEDAFAASAVFADHHGRRFAEPESSSFSRRGRFKEVLEDATPRIPMSTRAKQKSIGHRELRLDPREIARHSCRSDARDSSSKRDAFNPGAPRQQTRRLSEEDRSVTAVAGK